jgi:hypothetical protein
MERIFGLPVCGLGPSAGPSGRGRDRPLAGQTPPLPWPVYQKPTNDLRNYNSGLFPKFQVKPKRRPHLTSYLPEKIDLQQAVFKSCNISGSTKRLNYPANQRHSSSEVVTVDFQLKDL